MFAVLVLAGFRLPFPEDVVLLSAGALAHRHVVSIEAAAFVCFSGVLVGDLVIYGVAVLVKRRRPDGDDAA